MAAGKKPDSSAEYGGTGGGIGPNRLPPPGHGNGSLTIFSFHKGGRQWKSYKPYAATVPSPIAGIDVYVDQGKIVKIRGTAGHPYNHGNICSKGLTAGELMTSPNRVKHPLKRAGERGEDKWTQITWDEALDEIAGKLKGLRDAYAARVREPYPRHRTGLGRQSHVPPALHECFRIGKLRVPGLLLQVSPGGNHRHHPGRRTRPGHRKHKVPAALGIQSGRHLAAELLEPNQRGTQPRCQTGCYRFPVFPFGEQGGSACSDPAGNRRGAGSGPGTYHHQGKPARHRLC